MKFTLQSMSNRYNYHQRKRSFNQYSEQNNWNNDESSTTYKKRKYQQNANDKDMNNNWNDNNEYKDVLSLIKCNKPRDWTVSIALAGSVMNTAKTPQLQSYLVSQFARIISIFCIDEIVIFSEKGTTIKETYKSDPNLFFVRLLKYLETPQLIK